MLYRVARLDGAGSVVVDEPFPKAGGRDVVVDEPGVKYIAWRKRGLLLLTQRRVNADRGLCVEPKGQVL